MNARSSARVFSRLTANAKHTQWSADDLDWGAEQPPRAAWHDDSAFGRSAFEGSSLARYGPELWAAFRREMQSWMVSQFLPGEVAALTAAGRLRAVVSGPEALACLESQIVDEARHVAVFGRYLSERVARPYPVAPSLAALMRDALRDARWDVTVLGVHVIVEGIALSAFRLAERTFQDDLIKQICLLTARDEARHAALGLTLLQDAQSGWSAAERREREDLILEAVTQVSRRFALEQIWERLGIGRDEGVAFASRNPMMVAYRQAVCSRVFSGLAPIGLATPRVLETLGREGLLVSRPRSRAEAPWAPAGTLAGELAGEG